MPDPGICAMSRLFSFAIFLTRGDDFVRRRSLTDKEPLPFGLRGVGAPSACGCVDAAAFFAPAAGDGGAAAFGDSAIGSPSCPIVPTTLLTATVSPSLTEISVRMPSAGDGISASTLSVEISNSGSSRSTWSPTFLIQRTIVPSAIDSPIWGITMGVGMALYMDRGPVRRMRRFTNGFGERRVRVDRPDELFDRALEPQREDGFGDKLR